jgi:hypothetical protein
VVYVYHDPVWTTHVCVEITDPFTALVDVGWDTLKLVNRPVILD